MFSDFDSMSMITISYCVVNRRPIMLFCWCSIVDHNLIHTLCIAEILNSTTINDRRTKKSAVKLNTSTGTSVYICDVSVCERLRTVGFGLTLS